jgi:hypothetical protein
MTSLARGGVLLAALLAVACAPLTGSPATPESRDAIGERTARMETHDGFIPLHYDAGHRQGIPHGGAVWTRTSST